MFGEKIRTLRRTQGLTVPQLARLSGIKPRVLWSWERGERMPRIDNAQKVAEALGVKVDVLMEGK